MTHAGRLEVRYATFTDRRTGLGGWVHHETVTPTDGTRRRAHGWIALFPPDAAPIVERFDEGCVIDDGSLRGEAGRIRWDLTFRDGAPPLYTFPEVVWRRRLLPGAQIVPWPSAVFAGTVHLDDGLRAIDATGAVACIDSHGNAQRWGWLHADLDNGGTLEIVTATARRRGLRLLPPLAMLQLRLPGERDWPHHPLLAAPRLRTRLGRDGFTVAGRVGRRRIHVDVSLPPDGAVALTYVDPDGSTAVCTNSERASASISVTDRTQSFEWLLDGRAHAEVGHRAPSMPSR